MPMHKSSAQHRTKAVYLFLGRPTRAGIKGGLLILERPTGAENTDTVCINPTIVQQNLKKIQFV
jgi:hypothetical protein